MILYRFASKHYSNPINGEGARLWGGRWNAAGTPAVYCSGTISLSLLELLIHSLNYDTLLEHNLIVIDVPIKNIHKIQITQLKNDWQNDVHYSRFIGNEFLKQQSSLLLQVPSAIIPEESNFIINPKHKDFNKVKLSEVKSFTFDKRLFK
ncbi:MAG: RES family NAD+ phosphorylase [Sphingobacteriia bacterium]|nr:RES family NAD+ phosphorylase [Sphingobacteriia bacterium]